MRLSALLMVVLLSGCAVLRELDVVPGPVADGMAVRPVFLATDRAAEADDPLSIFYRGSGRGRAGALSFGRVDVTVPPRHRVGKMEWALKGQWNPRTHFTAREVFLYPGGSGFTDAVQRATPEGAPVMVFVHGFNVAGAEAVLRSAQVATDAGARGAVVAFSWPSMMRSTAYRADRRRAQGSAAALSGLLAELAGADRPIVLVTHSMGALVAMEALEELTRAGQAAVVARVRGLVLISPDLTAEQFMTQLRAIRPMPEEVTVMVSDRDQMLQLGGLVTRRRVLGAGQGVDALEALPVRVVDLSGEASGFGLDSHIAGMRVPRALEGLRDALRDVREDRR